MKKLIFIIMALILLGRSVLTNAALVDNKDGTVTQYRNDGSVLMWLKNASGLNSEKSWYEAMAWAENLTYAGYNDWRLPITLPANGISYNYNYTYDGSSDVGYNITSLNSELAYMYYVELGNLGECGTNAYGPWDCPQPGGGLTKTGPFLNLSRYFWSSTQDAVDPYGAWNFGFRWGSQTDKGRKSLPAGDAWAVRTVSSVSVVPEPISPVLFVIGGILLVGRRFLRMNERGHR